MLARRRSPGCPTRPGRSPGSGPDGTGPAGHVAPWRRSARSAPAVRVVILDRRPRPVVPTSGAARRARPRRPVHAIRPRRHPTPVRQPVPAGPQPAIGPAARSPGVRPPTGWSAARGSTMLGSAMLGSAVRHAAARTTGIGLARMWGARMRSASVRGASRIRSARVRPRVRRSALRHRAMRPAVVLVPAIASTRAPRQATAGQATAGQATARQATARHPASRVPAGAGASVRRPAGRETAWLARLRPARLAHTRLPGRHLARSPQQLPVVAVLGLGPTACPGRIIFLSRVPLVLWIGSRAIAATVALAPGGTVRVTAKAGVATFHPIPPGPWSPAARRDTRPYLLSVGRRKSPV